MRVRTEMDVGYDGRGGQQPRLLFEVEDSGRGIAAEHRDIIFQPFHQIETGSASGAGLGLAISRRLVQIMGGELAVASEIGQGSCFRFDIPLEKTNQKTSRKRAKRPRVIGLKPTPEPVRILVVDDNNLNRMLVRALLHPLGFTIEEAENGEQALTIFESWAPHCIFMDLRMPIMDGYEAIQRIKSTEAGRSTPIIALTASTLAEKEQEVLALGADAYMRKPFRAEELFSLLQQTLRLEYIMEDEEDNIGIQAARSSLGAGRACTLSQTRVAEIRAAVEGGDMARLDELIAQVQQADAAQAAALRVFAERYDYEKLICWLESRKEQQ